MKTELEIHEFELHWNNFLKMINNVAFKDLNLMKIFTYAYDLRPRLYNVLNNCNYKIEAKLVNHKIIENKFIDVIIHSKLNEQYIF
jgi:RimJ/RimL family protein N-acetyltransferase